MRLVIISGRSGSGKSSALQLLEDVGFIHQVAHDEYLKDHPDPAEIEYYLCGPPLMLDAVQEMLDSLGVDPEMIDFDDFGG